MKLAPIFHMNSQYWSLGEIANHQARPLTLEELESHLREVEETKLKLASAEAELKEQAVKFLHTINTLGTEMEIRKTAEARVKEFESREPKWCPDRCPITFRPFFMWIVHPEHGMVPTYGGPFDSYTIPEPEMPNDGKKTEFHDIEFYCERYDHDEGAWVDGSEDPGHRVILQDRLVELEEFSALKSRVKELEGE